MKKYSSSEKCAKCGNTTASTVYHSDFDGTDVITRTCSRCGYSWKNLPLTTNEQMGDGERRD